MSQANTSIPALADFPRIFCPNCDAVQLLMVDHRTHMLDLMCNECEFVIATLYADVPMKAQTDTFKMSDALDVIDAKNQRISELEEMLGRATISPRPSYEVLTVLRHVLQRCNENGGQLDAEIVAEIEAVIAKAEDDRA